MANYIALVDWKGRAFRDDKCGFIPQHLATMFGHLNMSTADSLDAGKSASLHYELAKGLIFRLKQYAEWFGKRWMRGQSYCKVIYQLAPD